MDYLAQASMQQVAREALVVVQPRNNILKIIGAYLIKNLTHYLTEIYSKNILLLPSIQVAWYLIEYACKNLV